MSLIHEYLLTKPLLARQIDQATREATVLERGELVFDQDLNELYVGDGTNMGGVPVYDKTGGLPAGSAGQVLYHDGSAWVGLDPEEDGAVLTLAGGMPKWVKP